MPPNIQRSASKPRTKEARHTAGGVIQGVREVIRRRVEGLGLKSVENPATLSRRARLPCTEQNRARQTATRMPTIERQFERLSDKELLRIRFCDLPIRLSGTVVEQRARQVFAELADREIKVPPSIWLSEEWFNPGRHRRLRHPFLSRPPPPYPARAPTDAGGRRSV